MSVKDKKEGMVAGAKPFEDKMREVQNANIAAVQKLCSENSNSIGELIDIAEEHDYLLNYDWKKEYELSSYAEKAIFLGLFKYCIKIIEGEKQPDDNQKLFFGNLCNKFNIEPRQIKEIEISKLKNNQDCEFQNLLYMSICNYFYIAKETFKFEKHFEDEVFQYFRVSKNDKNEIHELLKWTNDHLSLENMLTYSETQTTFVEASQNNTGCSLDDLEEYTIKELTFIKNGDEQIFNNKIIAFDANIKIGGKVIFQNCYINYGFNDSIISVDETGELTFENCVFTYKKNNDTDYFIQSNGKVIFINSLFEDCWGVCCSSKDLELEKSEIIYNKDFIPKKTSNRYLEYCLFSGKCNITNSYISASNIDFSKESDCFYDRFYIFSTIKTCIQTVFENCTLPACDWGTVIDSKFSNSKKLFEIGHSLNDEFIIKNSNFNDCESILKLDFWTSSRENLIDNCKFINCCNCLIEMDKSNLSITGCEFRNLKQNKSTSYILITAPENNKLTINKTIFDEISFFDYGYLINIDCHSITGTMTEKDFCQISVIDCMFGKMDRKTTNPVINKYCVSISQFVSKLSLKNVLIEYNNTGINDLLNKLQLQKNNSKLNELESIIHDYLPKFSAYHYFKTDIVHNKKASKKIEILKTLIPYLDEEQILGFVDLSVTGNINHFLVFTTEQCYYHYLDIFWTYYYNHPEISDNAILLYEDKNEKRIFYLNNSIIKDKYFDECITKIEALLSK